VCVVEDGSQQRVIEHSGHDDSDGDEPEEEFGSKKEEEIIGQT